MTMLTPDFIQIFHTKNTYNIMQLLMQEPSTAKEMAATLNLKNPNYIYRSLTHLKRHGLIKIKEFTTKSKCKVSIYEPIITQLTIKMGKN